MTYLLPPFLIVFLNYMAGVFDEEAMYQIVGSWPVFVFAIPQIIGIPIYFNYSLKKLEAKLAAGEYEYLSSSRKRLIWTFILVAALYSLTEIPVGYFNGFSFKQNVLALIISASYLIAGNVPFILRFTAQLDSLLAGVPAKYLDNSPVRYKTFLMTINLTVGGMVIIVASAYTLMWRMETMPELGYTADSILTRLIMLIAKSHTRYLYKIREFAKRIGEKDLSKELFISSRDEYGEIADDLNKLKSNFREVLNFLKSNATNLHELSTELNSLSGLLSDTSNTQAANAEEIAASVEETSANIAAALQNASESVNMSKTTYDSVEEGHQLITGTEENVRNISKKISTIRELSDQTNLLAINAFIEAANAGEQGKGFAVVAREIRALADRSKLSADEISNLAQQCVQFSGASVEKSAEMIDYISKTSEMAKLVDNSSKEQHLSIEQINHTVQGFNRSSQTLATSSQELSERSYVLIETARELDKLLNPFQV